MIKNIYYVRVAKDDAEFAQLDRFFATLGLDKGTSWQGRHNKGVLFRTPQAGIEVFAGDEAPSTDLVLEVVNVDSAFELCCREGYLIKQDLADQRWGGRMFVVEPTPGKSVSVFSDLPEHSGRHNQEFEGKLDARGKRFGIVVSRFNSFITDRLTQGALDALRRSGANDTDIEIVRVPGAFEIPSAARTLAQTSRVDAIVCIGCLIRGETTHYEHIAEECTRGIGQSAQETGVPHAYGVLTCENLEQAIDRAGLKAGNKGFEAGMAAVEMANLRAVVRKSEV
jgi:6,7-dimethyl-8-ribityllumazine synthase